MGTPRRIPLDQRLIAIEEDIYRLLVQNTRDFEDSPSTVLRRLLGIDPPGSRVNRGARTGRPRRTPKPRHELAVPIERAPWLPFDVQRYIYLVHSIQRGRPIDFKQVLALRGRSRRYFARSAREIEVTGTATQPKPVADTGYWALTNLPMHEKQRIIRNIMTMLGFSEDAMLAAREYLARGRIPKMPG